MTSILGFHKCLIKKLGVFTYFSSPIPIYKQDYHRVGIEHILTALNIPNSFTQLPSNTIISNFIYPFMFPYLHNLISATSLPSYAEVNAVILSPLPPKANFHRAQLVIIFFHFIGTFCHIKSAQHKVLIAYKSKSWNHWHQQHVSKTSKHKKQHRLDAIIGPTASQFRHQSSFLYRNLHFLEVDSSLEQKVHMVSICSFNYHYYTTILER